jgi:hypothetical protein
MGNTNIMASQYFGKTTKVGTWFATSKREKCYLTQILKELPTFWHQTNCMLNLLNLPMFWLGKQLLATKQALCLDVCKSRSGVPYVAMALHMYCKCMFQMF